ncbi:hypothetical protein BRD13_00180 [Halobacteriales archaeon SW_5_70_135]|nr:MAG: hypothetical protein BRD13_00180 [Halobacteriales archaeon SW_5_70_135]
MSTVVSICVYSPEQDTLFPAQYRGRGLHTPSSLASPTVTALKPDRFVSTLVPRETPFASLDPPDGVD